MEAITEEERYLVDGIMNAEEFAVLRATFDGEDVSVLAAITSDDDGTYDVTPLAILVTSDLMDRLMPDGEVVTVGKEASNDDCDVGSDDPEGHP